MLFVALHQRQVVKMRFAYQGRRVPPRGDSDSHAIQRPPKHWRMTMTVQAPIKHPDTFFIDGKWASPSSSAKINVLNSGTEELFASVAEAQEADINRAVAAARNAFDHGPRPRMTHSERASYLRAIGAEHDKRAEESAL